MEYKWTEKGEETVETKIIEIMGDCFAVPISMRSVAVDSDGVVFAYMDKTLEVGNGEWVSYYPLYAGVWLGNIDMEGLEWTALSWEV